MIQIRLAVLVFALSLYSLETFGQKKMTLFFKDGTTQVGYVTFKKKVLKFTKKVKGKKQKIEYAALDSLSGYINPRAKRSGRNRKPKTVYILPTGKQDKHYHVYDMVKQGSVNLYKYSTYGGYSGLWMSSGGGMGNQIYVPTGGGSRKVTIYGIKRSDEPYVTMLGNNDVGIAFIKVSDSFKKQGSEYFKDCSSLSEKIKNKEKGFTRKNLKKIVDYYNSECSK